MMTMLGLAIAALAAYWVFTDARGRGHEFTTAILWSLGTLAMLIIFLPLYLIVGRRLQPSRRSEKSIDIEAVPVEELVYCPMCGSKVKEDFKTCPYCSHSLRLNCEKCGRELDRRWRTCPYCEAPVGGK
ncbi:MAG: zinc ribbon domain-containing protein [Negativicutes bacterium]|nr:zinc ribbon domain-containing protein [Negativicutes bacterium]